MQIVRLLPGPFVSHQMQRVRLPLVERQYVPQLQHIADLLTIDNTMNHLSKQIGRSAPKTGND